jgi:hypothetical protein
VIRRALLALVVAAPAVAAPHRAASKAAAPATTAPASLEPPAPGGCKYVQPGVKICSPLGDGQGSFDVTAAIPAVLFVRTDEPIVNFIPPDPHFFQAEARASSVVIVPVQEQLPELTPAIITTKTQTITLRIHHGTQRQADTQLTIHDPLRDERGAELVQAVAAAEKRLQTQIAGDLRASELAELARTGIALEPPRGHTIARNSAFIVLEATRIVRLGARRVLFFVIENRSGDPFQVRNVRLSVADHAVAALPWKLDRLYLPPADVAHGALELPAEPRAQRLRLAVDELDPRRTVEIDGLEAR